MYKLCRKWHKSQSFLASPRKRGGGLTALQNRYSISSSFCNLPDCFQNCYTFCRQDGGDCVCLEDLKIVLLSISIPTVTARNSFRIVKAGLSEYCTASQKKLSAVPPPLFRGEASLVRGEGMVAILQWLWEWQY